MSLTPPSSAPRRLTRDGHLGVPGEGETEVGTWADPTGMGKPGTHCVLTFLCGRTWTEGASRGASTWGGEVVA